MKIYLAGTQERRWCVEDYMKIYLAGQYPWKGEGIYDDIIQKCDVAILESYYYADEWTEKTIPLLKNFLQKV